MNCFPELTYSVFVDGELSPEEARRIEAHLLACPGCRAQVEALRAEGRLLAGVLQEAEPETIAVPVAQPQRVHWLDLAWTTAVILGVAGSAQAAYNWMSDVETPAGTGWLNPFNLGLQLTLFFKSVFYFLDEGVTMLTSLSLTIATLVLAFGVIAGAVALARRRQMPHTLLMTLSALFALLLAAAPASAIDHRSSKKGSVVIKADETLDDTLVVHAQKVIVDGTITGNLIAVGKNIEVNGTVKGDVFAFASGVNIRGRVDGNLFVFTQGFNLTGIVGQSIYSFSEGANAAREAHVSGDWVGFAEGVNLDGTVDRDLVAFGKSVNVAGTVSRNVRMYTQEANIAGGASVGGNVTVHTEKQENVHVDPGATIGGKVETKIETKKPHRGLSAPFYLQITLGLLIVFSLGMLLHKFYPFLFTGRLDIGSDVGRAAGLGFIGTVATPAAAVVLCVILIGIGALAGTFLVATLIPALVLLSWMLALYLAKIFVGVPIGQLILRRPPGQPGRVAVPMLIGLIIVYIVTNLPYIGWAFTFVVWVLGLGLATLAAWRHYKRPAAA